jgi:hypothetical protein
MLVRGTRLGPYEIISPIGSGGMGTVYRSRDTRLGRDVAIKVMLNAGAAGDHPVARFERETQAVAALNHPNILALHDIGQESGVIYAVMELLDGETLRQRLEAAGRLTPLKAIDFAIQMLSGLSAAHERGIVHRDLKPENVFITREGRVKILDFGLAQQAASAEPWDGHATKLTGARVLVGTPAYMAPEQLVGEAATVRSDLFVFGVVVYEMMTGAHPFLRTTVADTATAIVREDAPPLQSIVPAVPAGVAKIVERCLEKKASDRPASARDLGFFLEAAAASGDGTTARPTVDATHVHRVRTRVLAVACASFILLFAATWGLVYLVAERAVTSAIEADLARAERLVRSVERERSTAVVLTTRLVASFPELKALFATDAATIRDYLLSYLQQNPEIPLLVALGPDGRVLARTDEVSASADENKEIGALAGTAGEAAIVEIRGRPYHASAASSDAGGTIFGYVVGALPIDAGFAAALREATVDEVLVLSDRGVVASTLRAGQTPWRSREAWREAGGRADLAIDVTIGTQRFAAREVVLADEPPLSAVVLESRDEAIEPFRRMQTGAIAIGLLCIVVAGIGSLWLRRSLASESSVDRTPS